MGQNNPWDDSIEIKELLHWYIWPIAFKLSFKQHSVNSYFATPCSFLY